MDRADLLVEIGTEEIPAGYIPSALEALRKRLLKLLQENGIECDAAAAKTYATPRRLTVLVPAVADRQDTRTERKLGPAVAAAFDADGNPTPAAKGFARSAGVEVDALQRIDTDKGERLGVEVTVGGASTRELLTQESTWRELLQLGFPKTMRWIPGDDFAFARPIRWLVCLHGDQVIPFKLAHLTAGRQTRGHRTLSPDVVELAHANDYVESLRRANVIVDPAERHASIDKHAHALAKQAGGVLHEAADLLQEVSFLTEHPAPVLGHYDAKVIETLPKEVLVTAMRSHQRYFSVEDAGGNLLPCFITFRDGGDHGLANVVEGNERVLRARLDDALFYWKEDCSHSSDQKLEALDRIVWLEGYGSIGDKSRRVAKLALALADELSLDVDRKVLERGALLSKTDLATEMIRDGKEFTKLQGTIGRYYALADGEPRAVADVIREHLHPRFATDRFPQDTASTLVALADRLDSITGCARAGFAPTGGQDPYALRRQALAVLRMLVDRQWHLDLDEWIARAWDGHSSVTEPAETGGAPTPEVVSELFWGRIETLLSSLPAEIVRAVLSVSVLDPVENVRAATALAELQGEESFDKLLAGAKRCRNILVKEGRLVEEGQAGSARSRQLRQLAQQRWGAWVEQSQGKSALAFRPDRLEEPAERELVKAAMKVTPTLQEGLAGEDHKKVYGALATLGGPIDAYFDKVLVNDERPEIRENRLTLLQDLHYMFARFADLSAIPSRG